MSTDFRPSSTPARPVESPPGGLKLADIYYILFRHQWLILISALVGVVAAGGIFFLKSAPYESEAKLLVKYVRDAKSFDSGPGSQVDVRFPDSRGENIINTEIEILTSRDLALDVADLVGPAKILAAAGGGTNRYAAAAMIIRGLQPEVGKKSSVIGITFRHPDPEMAQTILRQIVQSYLRKHTEVHRAAGLFDEMLTKQTDSFRSRLGSTEDQLQKLLANAGFASVEEGQRQVDQQIAQIQQALVTSQSDLAQHKAVLENLKRLAGVAPTADTNAVPAAVEAAPLDPSKEQQYQGVVARLDALRRRELDLLIQFTPESRDVKDVRDLIATVQQTKKQLEQEEPRLLTRARSLATAPLSAGSGAGARSEALDLTAEETQVVALEAKIKNLNEALTAARAQAAKLNTLAREAADLQIRKKEDETRYLYFSTSLDQARIDESLGVTATPGIQVVEEATTPVMDRAKIRKTALMVLAGGLGAGLGLAFLLEMFLDPRIKRPVDVEQKLRMPLFLFIPDFSRNGHAKALKASRRLPASAGNPASSESAGEDKPALPSLATNPLSTYHEALRDRLIMYFQIKELTHKPKLVGVTGASRKAGVSSIAAGLAEQMSGMGDGNVLLVDMNPQHGPSVYPFHHGQPICGLNEALEQEQRETAQVQDNLYVVSLNGESRSRVGIVPKRFASLMPKMKASDYDYIIFDMPPVSQTSVTAKVAGLLDMTFLVVESERTNLEQAKRCATLLAESRANVTAILNRYHDYLPNRLSADV